MSRKAIICPYYNKQYFNKLIKVWGQCSHKEEQYLRPYLNLFINPKNIHMIVYKYFIGIVLSIVLVGLSCLLAYSIYYFITQKFKRK